MNDKIKQLRYEMAKAHFTNHFLESSYVASYGSYEAGFDASWELHEKLVAPLLALICADSEVYKKYKEEVGE